MIMRLYMCSCSIAGYDVPEHALVWACDRKQVKKVLKDYYTDIHKIPLDSWTIKVLKLNDKMEPHIVLDDWRDG